MTFQIEVTARAERDLGLMYAFLEAELSAAAAQWFAGLERAILSLERFPRRGRLIDGKAGSRQLLYGTRPHVYRAFYRIDEHKRLVFILHVRHGARKGKGI